ncbi:MULTISPECIES: hypothetical protein [unclassified Streptomyces]
MVRGGEEYDIGRPRRRADSTTSFTGPVGRETAFDPGRVRIVRAPT